MIRGDRVWGSRKIYCIHAKRFVWAVPVAGQHRCAYCGQTVKVI